jgi:hypothetical protein
VTTYFTSDTHFGHAGMLSDRMGRPRPFGSREEHDEHLLSAWNAYSDEAGRGFRFEAGRRSEAKPATIPI